MITPKRIIIGISGTTGIAYAVRLLEVLRDLEVETHLVITKAGEMTAAYESDLPIKHIKGLADFVHPINDIGASISSDSYKTPGMIVAPCSMRSVGEIASGASSNLLTRAADGCLKGRRRIVLLARETPLHAGHLKAMLAVKERGGIIFPPVPAFYHRPANLEDVVDHTVGRVLDLFDLDAGLLERWEGTARENVVEVIPTIRTLNPSS